MALSNANKAINVISIAPTLSARCNPSTVPRATAPRRLVSFSIGGISTRPAVSGCSVSGTSILAISSVPGAVMMTAVKRFLGSAPPTWMYPAIMPPEMCAIPLVMTTISSDLVSFGRKGRMVSGASVWPIKMIENREEGGNEHDCGKHLEGKRKAKAGDFLWQTNIAEHERGARVGKTQQLICTGTQEAK